VSNGTTLVTTAILGLPIVEAVKLPGMREFMLQSGQEALDAGAMIGHQVLPIFGLKPDDMRATNRLVEKLLDTLLEGRTRLSSKWPAASSAAISNFRIVLRPLSRSQA
jgi:2-dehydropantoate 2-reductase